MWRLGLHTNGYSFARYIVFEPLKLGVKLTSRITTVGDIASTASGRICRWPGWYWMERRRMAHIMVGHYGDSSSHPSGWPVFFTRS